MPGDPEEFTAILLSEGNLSFDDASILEIDLSGYILGNEHDHLEIEGTLVLGGILDVKLIDSFEPQRGDVFHIFRASAIEGAFLGFNFTDALLAPDLSWNTSRLATQGILYVVPEPSPLSLHGMSAPLLLGWLAWRRRTALFSRAAGN